MGSPSSLPQTPPKREGRALPDALTFRRRRRAGL